MKRVCRHFGNLSEFCIDKMGESCRNKITHTHTKYERNRKKSINELNTLTLSFMNGKEMLPQMQEASTLATAAPTLTASTANEIMCGLVIFFSRSDMVLVGHIEEVLHRENVMKLNVTHMFSEEKVQRN